MWYHAINENLLRDNKKGQIVLTAVAQLLCSGL